MTHTKNIPDKARSGFSLLWDKIKPYVPCKGYFVLLGALLLLAAFAASDFSPEEKLLLAGDVAPTDIAADRTFLFEDGTATRAKIDNVRSMQPLVLDFVPDEGTDFRSRLHTLLLDINAYDDAEDKDAVRFRIAKELGEDLSPSAITALSSSEAQKAMTGPLLALTEKFLKEGVLSDMRLALSYKGGVVIRSLEGETEPLHRESGNVADLRSLEVALSQAVKQQNLPSPTKKAVMTVFSRLARPTLVPNYETTNLWTKAAEEAVEPVVHKVKRGETLIQKGERVTPDQQIKMQNLLRRKTDRFNNSMFLGVFLCGVLLSTGLLFAPSGRKGSFMESRDHIFLASLLVVFSFIAKGFALLGMKLAATSISFMPEYLAYAVPVAGAASLSALVFSARRYLVTGLLMAFFCTVFSNGGLGLFLFYFLAAMWSTFLTVGAHSRQETVWSFIPLTIGLFAMWAGTTLYSGGAHSRYFYETTAVASGAILSLALTFALAPVVEMVFRYTTRFRLMELLNLEQPILRDLMLNAPGTYHHSLIVSNMVEAGAKAIGAHSLLCKVAALYHDIGKISKAGYFIENQGQEENPHNRLSPSMSSLILISHVKQGAELAVQNRLGREVTDIIRQHHGTGVIQYFYQKALNQTDAAPPKIEDFQYPGPKPQSREAAIVMLADIAEASSRTLADPTPTRLRAHIDNVMKNVYAAGQLDESELTFRDLSVLAAEFQSMMRGLYHHRISYPGDKKTKQPDPAKPRPVTADGPRLPQ